MFEVGNFAYLSKTIIEPACGEHPSFLMGYHAEKVKILEIDFSQKYPYTVEGPSNPGKPWRAEGKDLMFTRPLRQPRYDYEK